MNYIKGNLITEALNGKFDVIVHGTNCFSKQRTGIAKQMAAHFDTDIFPLERAFPVGDINKLGQIDYIEKGIFKHNNNLVAWNIHLERIYLHKVIVINAYTQYHPGPDARYNTLRLCMEKINHIFEGKHIGLPKIGCGIGGLDWTTVDFIIRDRLRDCKVTIVEYENTKNNIAK